MRHGFTTGSSATAAAKAATYMLLSGKEKTNISIVTPKGITFCADIVDIVRQEKLVKCAVIKDGGDDPDITKGAHITVKVEKIEKDNCDKDSFKSNGNDGFNYNGNRHINGPFVVIDGGKGVGRVTKPGLDQPVGNAAINRVPRQMIEAEVIEICELFDYEGGIFVEVSVPEGEELAAKTFNPKLGIEGGISIIGTSGIVEPMSNQAILDTIKVELSQKKALGYEIVAVSPGNYGLDFLKNTYGYDIEKSIKCSNFIGATIDMAVELGFKKMLLTGHVGKLIKVSGGIMNTHSKEGDCRMELLVAAAIKSGLSLEGAKKLLDCVTTEDGIRIIDEENISVRDDSMKYIMEKIMENLKKRGNCNIEIECIMYANQYGLLSYSEGAISMMEEWRDKWSTL